MAPSHPFLVGPRSRWTRKLRIHASGVVERRRRRRPLCCTICTVCSSRIVEWTGTTRACTRGHALTVASMEPDGRPIRTSSAQDSTTGAARLLALRPHVGGKALPNYTRPRGSRLAFLILVSRVVLCTRLLVHGLRASSPVRTLGRLPGHLLAATLAQAPGLAKTSLSALDIRSAGNENHGLQLLPAHTSVPRLNCKRALQLYSVFVKDTTRLKLFQKADSFPQRPRVCFSLCLSCDS